MATEQSPARRTNRYTDAEVSLIKNTFAENDELIFAMRKVILQIPLTQADRDYLKVFKGNKALMDIVSKAYLPELEGEAPLKKMVDIWMLVPLSQETSDPDTSYPQIMAYQLVKDYFEEQVERLEDPEKEPGIDFKYLTETSGKSRVELFIDFKARNMIVVSNEGQLDLFYTLAGKKDESVDQMKKRLEMNSSK